MKFIDCCAGIGGFAQGIQQAIPNAECVLAIENNKYCRKVYETNFPNTTFWDDIKTIKSIPKHDLFCAGFPCQNFSICGQQKGFDGTEGTLFFEIIRLLKTNLPKYVLLENVPQIVKHNNFSIILSSLKDLGYDPKYYVLNSMNYGLAQYRKRCFIVCGFNISNFPHQIIPRIVEAVLEPQVNQKYWIDEPFYITQEKNTINTSKPFRLGHIKQGRQGERIYSKYAPSITLTAQGGGLAGRTGIYLVNSDKTTYHEMKYCTGGIRKLTPRECARLQGFKNSFVINVSDNEAWKQFGNAVSVNVVEDIVRQI